MVLVVGVESANTSVTPKPSGWGIHRQVIPDRIAELAVDAMSGMAHAACGSSSADARDFSSVGRSDLGGSPAHSQTQFHEFGNVRGPENGSVGERRSVTQVFVLVGEINLSFIGPFGIVGFSRWLLRGTGGRDLGVTGLG
jgi:hypothetical protein